MFLTQSFRPASACFYRVDVLLLFVKPEAKPLVGNLLSELDENQIYEGKSNPLIYLRYFDLNVRCNFEFTYFPFDTQKCTVWVRLHFFTIHKH